MARVLFDKIRKQYGKTVVIKELNLEIEDKEFLVLVGPSGCGKSTALRMIAGLEEITDGKLYIGDTVVNDVHPKDRDIAMVFQNYALYPHMSVRDNMGFALKLRKINKEEIEKRILEAAKILEIDHLLDRKPKALSGGQRQRVALGRAIVREPKVFLMDEPLSNLDAKLRVSMRAEIKKLHQRLQTTFVYVTHDQTEAITMGNRIAVMNKGDLQQVDTPKEVYNNPANIFVATFIGSPQMNLLEGSVRTENGKAIVTGKGFRFILNTTKSINNDKVIVGVRPEHLNIITNNQFIQDNYIESKVELIEPIGFEAYVYLEGTKGPIITRVTEEYIPELNTEVRFSAEPEKVYLFDANTEQRIYLN